MDTFGGHLRTHLLRRKVAKFPFTAFHQAFARHCAEQGGVGGGRGVYAVLKYNLVFGKQKAAIYYLLIVHFLRNIFLPKYVSGLYEGQFIY